MASRIAPPPVQQALPMELPLATPEAQMRALFEGQWSRWHHAKSYDEAVRDPVTRRLLELAAAHGARHRVQRGRGRR